jgi:hypothetical protein
VLLALRALRRILSMANKNFIKEHDKNIAQQVASIKAKYPNLSVTYNHLQLKVIGHVRPTSRSEQYTIEVKYHLKEQPKVRVLSPELVVNHKGEKIPHVYPGNRLCLFQPKYNEFTGAKFISDTIIPWTSLWLYHYEVWHVTGDWHGGGEHPNVKCL